MFYASNASVCSSYLKVQSQNANSPQEGHFRLAQFRIITYVDFVVKTQEVRACKSFIILIKNGSNCVKSPDT